MAGQRVTLEARTKKELKEKVEAWEQRARDLGLGDIRLGWDPRRAVKTGAGYSIELWAHA
jgi:hypothetical protein